MAEAPGSGRRALYKAVGSPPWKEAFRQVGVGFGKPRLGRRHSPYPPGPPPSRVPGEAGAGAPGGGRPAAGPGGTRTGPGAAGASGPSVRGRGEPAQSLHVESAPVRTYHPLVSGRGRSACFPPANGKFCSRREVMSISN